MLIGQVPDGEHPPAAARKVWGRKGAPSHYVGDDEAGYGGIAGDEIEIGPTAPTRVAARGIVNQIGVLFCDTRSTFRRTHPMAFGKVLAPATGGGGGAPFASALGVPVFVIAR